MPFICTTGHNTSACLDTTLPLYRQRLVALVSMTWLTLTAKQSPVYKLFDIEISLSLSIASSSSRRPVPELMLPQPALYAAFDSICLSVQLPITHSHNWSIFAPILRTYLTTLECASNSRHPLQTRGTKIRMLCHQ